MGKLDNIIGQRFGRLTVSKEVEPRKGGRFFECTCECGNIKTVRGFALLNGISKSCGCLRSESRREAATKHGGRQSREYTIWSGMIQRCNNPRNGAFEKYGGRGIKVCPAWESFENFYADMGSCPHDYSIERIDNNGNYEPGNCKWGTKSEQLENRRVSRRVMYKGTEYYLPNLVAVTGIPYSALHEMSKKGYDITERVSKYNPGSGRLSPEQVDSVRRELERHEPKDVASLLDIDIQVIRRIARGDSYSE